MNAAVIAVGTELLDGTVVNTNAAYISKELNRMGIDVIYHYAMDDNPSRLKRVLEFSMHDCDVIVCTGGLGPTEDDLTKETISEFLGEKLVMNDEAMDSMKSFFSRINAEFTENNFKQAYMPENSTVFQNSAGTAPGFAIEKDGKFIIAIPGVPREMKSMFEKSVKPYLSNLSNINICSKTVNVFGLGESAVEMKLINIIEESNDPVIATYAKEGVVEISITSRRNTYEEAENATDNAIDEIMKEIGNYVYSTEGEEIYEATAKRLFSNNITISCCESPTAGIFAASLAKVPGISKVFDRGLLVYSTESKIQELGIPATFFMNNSPYGREAASEMAKALNKKTGSRLCISVTGVAGPEGYGNISAGSYNISIIYDGKQTTREFFHNGRTRQMNREFMVLCMFDMINHIIDGKELIETW